MRKEELAGLARVVIYRREQLLLLQPRGKGLMATTLRYKNEVRDEKDYFDDIPNVKVSSDMLKLATHILDTKKGKFDPEKFEDRYETRLQDLIKAKKAGKEPPIVAEPKPSNVINLMDALKRSVKGEKEARHRRKLRPRRRRARAMRASDPPPAQGAQSQLTRRQMAGCKTYWSKAPFRRHR